MSVTKFLVICLLFFFLTMVSNALAKDNICEIISYKSSISSDIDGRLNLHAEVNYNRNRIDAPIAVLMHGYSGGPGNAQFKGVRANAQRLVDVGFFTISVDMRGRGGCDGVRDSGGLEIYDIYDAVEYVKSKFASYVDPTNVYITGYSGGGGNTMSALTKFPDYFRAGAGFFGISDYGYNLTNSWYFNGANGRHQKQMKIDVGDPAVGDPAVSDRYAARASNLASRNNPYSEIHLFINYNEPICPPINETTYRDNAVAHACFSGEFDNITVHIGGFGKYKDFNGNGIDESNELQSWPHHTPTADEQYAAEAWFLDRLLNGSISQPVLNLLDELYVAGYVKTKPFSLWLGDGQNAAGQLNYSLSAKLKSFHLKILTNDKTVTGTLKVQTVDMDGYQVVAKLGGIEVERFEGGGEYVYNGLKHGELLELVSKAKITHKGPK